MLPLRLRQSHHDPSRHGARPAEALTPVEDTSKRWVGPWESVERLIVPRQDVDTAEARLVERRVDQLAFNPWNTTEEFRR